MTRRHGEIDDRGPHLRLVAGPGVAWTRDVLLAAGATAIFMLTLQSTAVWHAIQGPALEGLAQSARDDLSGRPADLDQAPEPLALNWVARSGPTDGRQVILVDGSQVEMRARTELRVERADDGLAIRLHTGRISVRAAKSARGHLYVKTADMTVAAAGSIFWVSTNDDGSRVGVIAGEAQVSEAGVETTVRPGEEVATMHDSPSTNQKSRIENHESPTPVAQPPASAAGSAPAGRR